MRRSVRPARLLLLLASLVMSLGALEVVLRMKPSLLGQEFVNGLRSRYTVDAAGIYELAEDCDGHLLQLMKPGFEAEMYYNGYEWHHLSDRYGFRNVAERERADIVLLGDSFVYGHGLEIEETVGVRLEELTGLTVTSLGRQGDYAVPQAYLLSRHLQRLEAGIVVYVFYENDIQDVYLMLDEARMRQYIDSPVDRLDRCADAELVATGSDAAFSSTSLYVVKAHKWLRFRYFLRRKLERFDGFFDDGDSLGWQVTRSAILRMQYETEKSGARLLVVPVTPTADAPDVILARFAADHGIGFVETPTMTESNEALFLPGDGHFSARGALELAEVIAAAVQPLTNVTADN